MSPHYRHVQPPRVRSPGPAWTPGRQPSDQPRDRSRRAWSWADEVRPYEPCPLPDLAKLGAPADPPEHTQHDEHTEHGEHSEEDKRGGSARAARRRGLLLTPFDDPRREEWIVLGRGRRAGRPGQVLLHPADARYHLQVMGITGSGKSTWLANWFLQYAQAGRGVALIDCQGDLAVNVLARLPRSCADRLVILDPDEPLAPPAYNPLAPDDPSTQAAEWAAERVAGTLKALYSASWGARMQDLLRGACLTLARRPGSTIPDLVRLLTDDAFRTQVLAKHPTPAGFDTLWDDYDAMTANQRANLRAPLVTRLRDVLGRRFARDLLSPPASTFGLGEVLDGGVLIARLPKGEIGTETSRLVSGLLVADLWGATTRRARRDPDQRPDATIVLDEAHNMASLPIEIDFALAESRGYRVGWVLAHQHGDQLPPKVSAAVAANARNKLFFTLEPDDARKQARHFRPRLDEHDLAGQRAYHICARIVGDGHDQRACTLDSLPLPEPVPGRAEWLRARARARTGLSPADRHTTSAATPETADTAEATSGATANTRGAGRAGRPANGRTNARVTARVTGRADTQRPAPGLTTPDDGPDVLGDKPATPNT